MSGIRMPIVLVHGGGGQGLDWMGTPDGRPRLADVPPRGRLQGLRRRSSGSRPIAVSSRSSTVRFAAQTNTLEGDVGRSSRRPTRAGPRSDRTGRCTTSGRGPARLGSPDLDQLVASQGGSYVSTAAAPAAAAGPAWPGGGGRGTAPGGATGVGRRSGAPPVDGGSRIGWPETAQHWSGGSAARCSSTRSVRPSS